MKDISFQERLMSLANYNVVYNVSDGNIIIKICFSDDWIVQSPTNKDIAFAEDNQSKGTYWYVCPMATDTINAVFKSIDDTIFYNKEIELKKNLFRDKINELKTIFENEDYEILKTLEFKVKNKKDNIKSVIKNKNKSEEKNNDNSGEVIIINEKTSTEENIVKKNKQQIE